MRLPLFLGGLAGVVGGVLLLAYGLAPAGEVVDAVGPALQAGGPPPSDMADRIDASVAEMSARGFWDGLGLLAGIGGAVMMRTARRPATTQRETLLHEAMDERMHVFEDSGIPSEGASEAALPSVRRVPAPKTQAATAATPPAAIPTYTLPGASWSPQPVPVGGQQLQATLVPPQSEGRVQVVSRPGAWPASSAPKICPACGGRLVAGGRSCVACRQTFA